MNKKKVREAIEALEKQLLRNLSFSEVRRYERNPF